MSRISRVIPETVLYTAECANEAVILRAFCESRWPIGAPTIGSWSMTGEEYEVLTDNGYISPEAARLAAQSSFEDYAKDKSGILYWRITPEIALMCRSRHYSYYLRLLISDKPAKSAGASK